MKRVHILDHAYEIYNGGNYLDFEVFIGTFSSEEKSREAAALILSYGFFKDRPDNFEHSPVKVDEIGWSDRFASWDDGDWEEDEVSLEWPPITKSGIDTRNLSGVVTK